MTQYEYTYDENGEPTLKLYGGVSVMGQPEYDDIVNSDLPKEEKVKQIKWRGQAYRDKIDDQLHKDYARIGLGGLVSAIGALPIAITKNPVIGSAIGGGVYELGQGIMEGDEFPELMQRAGWGGAIGGTVGGAVSKLPDAARFVNNLSGGRIGEGVNSLANKLGSNRQVLNATRNLNNFLNTDINKLYNPFKYTEEVQPLFVGETAFNAPKGKLGEAQQMAMYGDSNADIRNATGWFKGVDGKWRYEIPDGKMIDNPKLVENFDEDIGTYYTGKLSDIYNAPELYQAYPQLANRDIVIQSMPEGYGGSSWGDSISINRNYFQKDNPEFLKLKAELENTPEYKKYDLAFNTDTGDAVQDLASMDKAQKEFFDSEVGKQYHSLMWDKNYPIERKVQGFNDDAIKTLVHETQHQIQGIEDFARGGNGESPDYWNLAGEVEARLAGARSKLTPEQRQIYNPANESTYLTNYGYDVIPEKQIVKFRDDGKSLYKKLTNNNGVVDLTNSFSKNPTIAEVKAHIQSLINNGIKYDTLSPYWKIDIIGGKAKANHIVKSSQYGKMNKSKANRHNKYIASIEDLINNSTYSNSKTNTKIAKKPNVDKYHYFETNVKIGNKQYKVILNAEQFKGESTIKPQTVHLYDVLEIK